MATSVVDTTDNVTVLGRTFPYKYAVAIVFVVALFLDIMDTTIINVALPTLGVDFRTESVEWVVLGYTLSLAVWIPVSGWLGDKIGTKRTFLFALGIFVVGSALCGLAQSIGQLIFFRVLQGVGGGMLTPIGTAMLFRSFPPAERAKAATWMMIPTLAAPALGPIVGGLLVTHASWRWIFYVNVPIGVAALAFGWTCLREHREDTAGSFDLPGFALSATGLALVIFALSEGPAWGWDSFGVLGTATVGMACLVALVQVELRRREPLLALRLLGNRMFRSTNVVSAFAMAGFLGLLFVMPLYLQNLRGLSALQSGLTTFPQAIGVMISSQVAGRLYKRTGPRRLIAAGLLWVAVAMAVLVGVDMTTSLWLIRVMMFARGLGLGFTFVPMQASSYATIAPADNGRASSMFAVQRQVAISVGVAVLSTVVASYGPLVGPIADQVSALHGYHLAFLVAAAFALGGSIAAIVLVRDSDAAATMAPNAQVAAAH